MEDPTQKPETAMGETEHAPSNGAGMQPVNSDLPDWYIHLVHQAMERTGEDLSFYLNDTTKRTPNNYDAAQASVKRNTATENSNAEEKATEHPDNNGALDFHKRLVERSKKFPKQDMEIFPPDFTENLDHYLYGMPKKMP